MELQFSCLGIAIRACGLAQTSARIPFFASWPATIILPTASVGAVFLISSILSDSGSPGRGQPWLLQACKSPEVPHFKRFLRHLPVPSPCFVRLSFAGSQSLRRWYWQRRDPPHHDAEKPPRQMALRQEQATIASMFAQPPASLCQPLLRARQRLRLDLTLEMLQYASQDELHGTDDKFEPVRQVKYMLANGLSSIWRR